jgi:hypothetical protein
MCCPYDVIRVRSTYVDVDSTAAGVRRAQCIVSETDKYTVSAVIWSRQRFTEALR